MKVSFWLAALLLAATLPATGAAGQELAVSPPGQIAAGARACVNALTGDGLDARRLASEGWADRHDGEDGVVTSSGTRRFTRESVWLLALPTFPNCIVVARIAGAADFQAVVTALTGTMGAPEVDVDGKTRWTLADGKTVVAEITGTADDPGIGSSVGTGGSLE